MRREASDTKLAKVDKSSGNTISYLILIDRKREW